jgi:hypothetical protein
LALTASLVGVPSFSPFATSTELAVLSVPSTRVTFSGTTTGQRYAVSINAIIGTAGGGANYFPGTIAGTSVSGGIYS